MDWSNEDIVLLLDLVRRRPCLYDKENESYHNPKVKQDVIQELASIISSTRPGTTAQDILEKWEDVCSKYTMHCRKIMGKKKIPFKFSFADKMEFMKPHLGLPLKNPVFIKNASIRNKDTSKEHATESNRRSSQDNKKYPCLELSRVEPNHSVAISDEENDFSDLEANRGSVSAISIHSDNSPQMNRLPLQLNSNRKRRHSTMSMMSPATRNQDISCVTIGSPLVNVSDSILDRTEPFVNEYQSYGKVNGSYESKDMYSLDEDEDHYYMKYILCKVKKLEGAQKLNFKLQLERLLYECTKQ